MGASVWLRRLPLIAGLALLAVYAGIRLDGALQSRARVRAFDQQRRLYKLPKPRRPLPDRPAVVDFSLWSPNRVQGFLSSLQTGVIPPLAVLRIPKIALEVPVLAGTDEVALNRGVGWIEGTALPSGTGNIGLAGHRDGFFRALKDVRVGDTLELQTLEAQDEYLVDSIEIVTPQDSTVLGPRARPSLTLVTCYPFYFVGNAPQRYIVHASLMAVDPPDGHRLGRTSALTEIGYQEKIQ